MACAAHKPIHQFFCFVPASTSLLIFPLEAKNASMYGGLRFLRAYYAPGTYVGCGDSRGGEGGSTSPSRQKKQRSVSIWCLLLLPTRYVYRGKNESARRILSVYCVVHMYPKPMLLTANTQAAAAPVSPPGDLWEPSGGSWRGGRTTPSSSDKSNPGPRPTH